MWYLQSTDEFKQKFPEIAAQQDDSTLSIKLRTGARQE